MGRHKFEDQFKTALENREIKPTEGSWEKLTSRLETKEKKTLPLYWWLGIAATVVGAIFIAGMVYNNEPVSNSPVIVETPSEEEKDEKNFPVQNVGNTPPESIASKEDRSEDPSVNTRQMPSGKPEERSYLENEKTNPAQLAGEEISFEAKESQYAISDNQNVNSEFEEDFHLEIQITEESAFAAEIQEVLERIAIKENQSGKVSDAEVNVLLAEAASQITRRRTIEKADGRIDATALLWDVEMEMEHSFREKVFEVLKESYLKAKSAVANRNY